MASFTTLAALSIAILALLPAPLLAQQTPGWVCAYCRGAMEAPDATAVRFACSMNAQQSLDCPVSGPLPDCNDQSLIQPSGQDLPDGCDDFVPASLKQQSDTIYQCPDFIRYQGRQWELRAVITDLACPDNGSIWTECSYSTPFCQPRPGLRAVSANGQVVGVGEALPGALLGFVPSSEIPAAETAALLQAVSQTPTPEQATTAGGGAGGMGAGAAGGGA